MAISITERDVAWIIEQVMKNVEQAVGTGESGDISPKTRASETAVAAAEVSAEAPLFVSADEAIAAAHNAQREYATNFKIEDRNKIIVH
jgi:hypothetical protein